MLSVRTILRREGITISDVECRHERGRGEAEQYTGDPMLVFVRRGCFVRSTGGDGLLLDSSVAFCVNPHDEQRYDHPHSNGDDCTSLALDDRVAGSVLGSADRLPSGALHTSPGMDLEHRLLLAAAGRNADQHEVIERAVHLVATALAACSGPATRVRRGRSEREHRRLADGAREALAYDPDRSLTGLAQALAVSPAHLSRVFRLTTGETVARHRLRVRARRALEQLAAGQDNLARLAADTGFADQSHLCRVLRAETGVTPRELRHALSRA